MSGALARAEILEQLRKLLANAVILAQVGVGQSLPLHLSDVRLKKENNTSASGTIAIFHFEPISVTLLLPFST